MSRLTSSLLKNDCGVNDFDCAALALFAVLFDSCYSERELSHFSFPQIMLKLLVSVQRQLCSVFTHQYRAHSLTMSKRNSCISLGSHQTLFQPLVPWLKMSVGFSAVLRGTTTRDLYSHFGLELEDWRSTVGLSTVTFCLSRDTFVVGPCSPLGSTTFTSWRRFVLPGRFWHMNVKTPLTLCTNVDI